MALQPAVRVCLDAQRNIGQMVSVDGAFKPMHAWYEYILAVCRKFS